VVRVVVREMGFSVDAARGIGNVQMRALELVQVRGDCSHGCAPVRVKSSGVAA